MATIPVDVKIYRCNEAQVAAAQFTLPSDPMLFLLGTTDLIMMLNGEGSPFELTSSFQNRTVAQLAAYGSAEELETIVRDLLAHSTLSTWEIGSLTTEDVNVESLQAVLRLI